MLQRGDYDASRGFSAEVGGWTEGSSFLVLSMPGRCFLVGVMACTVAPVHFLNKRRRNGIRLAIETFSSHFFFLTIRCSAFRTCISTAISSHFCLSKGFFHEIAWDGQRWYLDAPCLGAFLIQIVLFVSAFGSPKRSGEICGQRFVLAVDLLSFPHP